MLRITKQADYAIVLLSHFITDAIEGDYTARDLSVETGISLPMVGKILKALVHRGLLISHRGVNGGYHLARPAESISVAAIIEAIDGPIGLTTCSVHAGECAHEERCPSRGNWSRINNAVLKSLRGISLADMARPTVPLPHLMSAESKLTGEIA
ncbi:MAG: SUF system Fe-S cluster assembly regulator [Candidatus Eisenbacteria bacterium]|nr:SUF system Fe-S cluster assembly regulator [Candidatus Eisenbacteria bacterium]